MKQLVSQLIAATNAFDVKAALALFSPEAVIKDVSVGETFTGTTGVQTYLERYFVGYHTSSQVVSIDVLGDRRAKAYLDFTGDFGHETGVLDITTDVEGRIVGVAADLD